MTLGVETQANQIHTLTGDIKTKHESNCSTYPWDPNIQDKLNTVDSLTTTIKNDSLTLVNDDMGSMIDSNKNFGLPCGSSVAIDISDITDTFTEKWDILNKMIDGGIFNEVISKLQDAYNRTLGQCIEIDSDISDALDLLNTRTGFINNISNIMSQLGGFFDEVISIIGTIGSLLGCADELYTAVNSGSSWIGEINSQYGEGLSAVRDAKSVGGSAADIYNNSINNANVNLGWDSRISSLKSDFQDSNLNFPS